MTLLTGVRAVPRGYQTGIHPETILPGEDSVSVLGMQRGLAVYCGYNKGSFTNYQSVVDTFPGAKYIAISPFITQDTDCLDDETGDATPDQAAAFVAQCKPVNLVKPMIYANASTWPAINANLSGTPRDRYFKFLADWDGSPGIPGDYDAKQYANHPGYDADVFESYLWTPVPPPPPVPTGTPTGLHGTSFASVAQLNVKWDAVDGPAKQYEVQLERLETGGWMLVAQISTSSTVASFTNLAHAGDYRWRVSRGAWSDWLSFKTP